MKFQIDLRTVAAIVGTAIALGGLGACSGDDDGSTSELMNKCRAGCDSQADGRDCDDVSEYATECKKLCPIVDGFPETKACQDAANAYFDCMIKTSWTCEGSPGTFNDTKIRVEDGTINCEDTAKEYSHACFGGPDAGT